MNTIELQQTLPAVFAGRDSIISDVWHQSLTLKRGEAYLVEAASGTGKSSLCSYVYGYRNDYQGIICFDGKKYPYAFGARLGGDSEMFHQYVVSGITFVYRTDSVGECAVEEFADRI